MRWQRVLLAATTVLVACGDDDDTPTADSTGVTSVVTAAPPASTALATPLAPTTIESTGPPTTTIDAGGVVGLGEEFILADLLALGIEPVASSATVDEAGFQELDEFDTSDIEILSGTEPNLERLAALRPDTIVTTGFVAEAAALTAEVEAARAELRAAVEGTGCEVSLATIYPGPSVAAWIDGTSDLPAAFVDAGCSLVPDSGGADDNGRVFLSLEQLGLLWAPLMVLLQSDLVEGEAAAVEELDEFPGWAQVPAVQASNVVVFDRLGYPGAAGEIRFHQEVAALLG